jgi:hypothetical protein
MSLPALISALAGIFGIAFFWFWGAIPAGLALGLNPILVAVTVWLSYVAGVVLVVVVGEPIRVRLMARFAKNGSDRSQSAIQRVWDRFGLIGLALLAPVTTGSQIGAALGLSLGVKPRQLVLGMALGAAAWAAVITLAALLGVTAIRGPR